MPRQSSDVIDFKYGVISAVDEEDIPPESASDSLNVDGDVADGILQGIPSAVVFEAPTGSDITNIRLGEFIEHDGIYDLVYHDKSADTICVIVDFYNTNSEKKKITLISSLGSDNVTMTKSGKEVHIGIEGTYAYWAGRIEHGQFSYGYSWNISTTTGDGVSPIVVTAAGHTLSNGDLVRISGVAGNTAANGVWVVASSDNFAGTFALTGSTGNGAYSAGADTASIYMVNEYAQCERSSGTGVGEYSLEIGAGVGTEGYFASGLLYRWGYSLIYDGLQESPLVNSNTYEFIAAGIEEYYPITIKASSATPTVVNTNGRMAFNKRVTGVNLYRADSIDGTAGNLGLFRLVASVDINDASWDVADTIDQDIIVNDYGTYYTLGVDATIFPMNPVTYKENTGIMENFLYPALYYGLSTSGNGYQFVAKCSQVSLAGNESRRVFRSKQFRYDMFDYYTDFLEMPEPISALKFSEGKLFVFATNNAYQVNPEGMFIERAYENVGAQGQRAVHENAFGLFFCNVNGAWMIQRGQVSPLVPAIKNSKTGGKSWATFSLTTLTDFMVTSDGLKDYVLFINEREDTGKKIFCWAYSPVKKRWDAWNFASYTSSANDGVFKGKDGEVYLSCNSKTYKLMRPSVSTYTEAWEWYSQDFTFGKTRQNKSISMIKVDASGTVSINYGFEGGNVTTAYANESLINQYKKSIRVKLNANAVSTGTSYTNNVDSMELVYRHLIGER